MSPWNYPVLLALEPLTDALAAGNLRPVHLILEYKSLEEAADKINSMDSPLALYIFSSTKRTSALLKTAYNSAKAASTTLLYTSQQAKWALAR